MKPRRIMTTPVAGGRVRYTNPRWGTLYATLTGKIKLRSPRHLGMGWEAISERTGKLVVLNPSILLTWEKPGSEAAWKTRGDMLVRGDHQDPEFMKRARRRAQLPWEVCDPD